MSVSTSATLGLGLGTASCFASTASGERPAGTGMRERDSSSGESRPESTETAGDAAMPCFAVALAYWTLTLSLPGLSPSLRGHVPSQVPRAGARGGWGDSPGRLGCRDARRELRDGRGWRTPQRANDGLALRQLAVQPRHDIL